MKNFAHDYIDECNKLKIRFVLINITKKKKTVFPWLAKGRLQYETSAFYEDC